MPKNNAIDDIYASFGALLARDKTHNAAIYREAKRIRDEAYVLSRSEALPAKEVKELKDLSVQITAYLSKVLGR